MKSGERQRISPTYKKTSFYDDLTKKDKDARAALRPVTEKTHKDGIKAFFIGTEAYGDGKEVSRANGH